MTNPEYLIWGNLRTMFSDAAFWLENLLLGQKLSSKAYKDGLYSMPLAELLAADFRLIVALHSRASDPALLHFPDPATLWLGCCVETSEEMMKSAGLTGNPSIIGKRENCELTSRVVKAIEAQKYTVPFDRLPTSIQKSVYQEAFRLAKVDHSFHLNYLLPYLRAVKKYANCIKGCKHLQMVYLDRKGAAIVGGKGVKLSR
ncbi:hypothetical protein H0X32_04200 [Patescibacteria group bacterium]|nr:hypothetical protein [Patescibacteria group bacterium]